MSLLFEIYMLYKKRIPHYKCTLSCSEDIWNIWSKYLISSVTCLIGK